MLKRITKKKSLLLTAAVLAAMSVPAYAAEKKPEDGKAIKTGAVVVTASRTKQEVKETPSSVEVITREDIEAFTAPTIPTWEEGAARLREAYERAITRSTTSTPPSGARRPRGRRRAPSGTPSPACPPAEWP